LQLDTFGAVLGLGKDHEFWKLAAETAEAVDPDAKFEKKPPAPHGALLCSVVKEVQFKCLDEGQDVCAGVKRHGRHGFHVRDFGNIFLGEVLFQYGQKTLTMLRVDLGSPNGAGLAVVQALSNGRTWP
jgi:hypothetical protein